LIVPVGISALEEPGSYSLRVDLVSGEHTAAFTLTLDVAPGNYGFQTINPPPSLAALMDPALRATEDAYLAQWRSLRSPERLWELPLAWPLAQVVPVSADYGDRRSYGGTVDGYHSGVDFRAWTGMQVLAPADGVVVMAEALEMRGNSVLLDHGAGLVTGYWHLSRIDVGVGETVTRGQPFALVGNTGLSTGAHLHWELWANGVSVDGKQWLRDDAFGGVFPIGGGAQLVSDEVVAE
jgi:murein DD-endopeptidase MepM/ murein hydrolase activator NlpD